MINSYQAFPTCSLSDGYKLRKLQAILKDTESEINIRVEITLLSRTHVLYNGSFEGQVGWLEGKDFLRGGWGFGHREAAEFSKERINGKLGREMETA